MIIGFMLVLTFPIQLLVQVADLMRMCWHSLPANRPSFDEIRTIMADFNLQEIDNWFSRGRHALPGGARTANQLLYDVFPAHVANTLRQGKKVEPEQHDCVTIFFSDIVGFTDISRMLQPIEVQICIVNFFSKAPPIPNSVVSPTNIKRMHYFVCYAKNKSNALVCSL